MRGSVGAVAGAVCAGVYKPALLLLMRCNRGEICGVVCFIDLDS